MSTRIPDFLKDLLIKQYGDGLTESILDGYAARRPVTLRANTLKADAAYVGRCLEEAGIAYRKIPWYPDAFLLEEACEAAVRKLPLYDTGQIYLQSLSSMIPPLILEPQEGENILDMCAAPGGKTTQLAALSKNRTQITACEKNPVRAERLRFNLDRQGASKVFVMTVDARKLDPYFSFDKILLDAPCSGSGTLSSKDASPEGGKNDSSPFTKELLDRSVRTQEALLLKALSLLKPDHEMVYSTCSILCQENELPLKKALSRVKAKIVPIQHPLLSEVPLLPTLLPGTCCIRPTRDYEGFFVAKLRKG